MSQNVKASERYLHFDNLDLQQPEISGQCSKCHQQFNAVRGRMSTSTIC